MHVTQNIEAQKLWLIQQLLLVQAMVANPANSYFDANLEFL